MIFQILSVTEISCNTKYILFTPAKCSRKKNPDKWQQVEFLNLGSASDVNLLSFQSAIKYVSSLVDDLLQKIPPQPTRWWENQRTRNKRNSLSTINFSCPSGNEGSRHILVCGSNWVFSPALIKWISFFLGLYNFAYLTGLLISFLLSFYRAIIRKGDNFYRAIIRKGDNYHTKPQLYFNEHVKCL